MKKFLFLLTLLILGSIDSLEANPLKDITIFTIKNENDSIRLVELNEYWTKLSKTVETGDFEGYSAMYHADAVVVFTSGKHKASMPISKALEGWKKGFNDTKKGKQNDTVEFRFSQRIGDETTAHETGIFLFTSIDEEGKVKGEYLIHFEMLLIKGDDGWKALMEYQTSDASKEEWGALK